MACERNWLTRIYLCQFHLRRFRSDATFLLLMFRSRYSSVLARRIKYFNPIATTPLCDKCVLDQLAYLFASMSAAGLLAPIETEPESYPGKHWSPWLMHLHTSYPRAKKPANRWLL
jgi:hypothetical protein